MMIICLDKSEIVEIAAEKCSQYFNLNMVLVAAGDSVEDESLDSDVKVALTEVEAEIRSYLLHGEPLSEETIEKFANIFWNHEPYRCFSPYTLCILSMHMILNFNH